MQREKLSFLLVILQNRECYISQGHSSKLSTMKDPIVCLEGGEAVKYWQNITENGFCGECILTFLLDIC